MPWSLILAPRAEKELVGLPARDQDAVGDALSRLGSDPTRVDLSVMLTEGKHLPVRKRHQEPVRFAQRL